MKPKNTALIAIILACCVIVIGMYGYSVTRPNVRWFEKGNIKFWANLNINDAHNYNILEIGTPEEPYSGFPFLYLQTNDKGTISLNLPGNAIKALGERVTPAQGEYPVDWPQKSELVYLGAYTFVVNNNKLLSFSARHLGSEYWEKNAPKISKNENGPFYKFPLTEDEVRELIGEPESMKGITTK